MLTEEEKPSWGPALMLAVICLGMLWAGWSTTFPSSPLNADAKAGRAGALSVATLAWAIAAGYAFFRSSLRPARRTVLGVVSALVCIFVVLMQSAT
jgi:urea transporter